MITSMSVNNSIFKAGFFQIEVSDAPSRHGGTLKMCDVEYGWGKIWTPLEPPCYVFILFFIFPFKIASPLLAFF